jgi:uncharacterized ion transporter superfamily protein YfcC
MNKEEMELEELIAKRWGAFITSFSIIAASLFIGAISLMNTTIELPSPLTKFKVGCFWILICLIISLLAFIYHWYKKLVNTETGIRKSLSKNNSVEKFEMNRLPKSKKIRRIWILIVLSVLILVDILCYFTLTYFNKNSIISLSLLSGLVVALISFILRWIEEGK